jgi:Caulimovirus viroplasmin
MWIPLYRLCVAAYIEGLRNHAITRRNSLHSSFLTPSNVSFSYFSTRSSSTGKRARTAKQTKTVYPQPLMKQESEAFYVVRKGDMIGVYKSLSECQAQVNASVKQLFSTDKIDSHYTVYAFLFSLFSPHV